MDFFGIGFQEVVVVLVIALLVLGPAKMTDVAKTMGKVVRDLRRASSEVPKLLSMEEDDKPQQPPAPPRQQIPDQPSPKEPDAGKDKEEK